MDEANEVLDVILLSVMRWRKCGSLGEPTESHKFALQLFMRLVLVPIPDPCSINYCPPSFRATWLMIRCKITICTWMRRARSGTNSVM